MLIINILIILGYLIILILCVTIAFHGNTAISSDQLIYQRKIFIGIAVILIIMTAARFLNLFDYLIEESRMLAKYEGWYEGRHTIQMLFVSGLIIFGIMLFIFIERNLGIVGRYYSVTFYGIIFLIGFIFLTTVSYHPIDQLLKKELVGIKYSKIIEFLNITWIAISLLGTYRRSRYETKVFTPASGSKFI